jgi:uncharacterized protein (DUF2132 family)
LTEGSHERERLAWKFRALEPIITPDELMPPQHSNDPLHGLTLEVILTRLVEHYGWEELAHLIQIRCFMFDPSIQSSLKFLRKTPWARKKVEDLYLWVASQRN